MLKQDRVHGWRRIISGLCDISHRLARYDNVRPPEPMYMLKEPPARINATSDLILDLHLRHRTCPS